MSISPKLSIAKDIDTKAGHLVIYVYDEMIIYIIISTFGVNYSN